MRKAISLFLSAMVLCISTSAMAAVSVSGVSFNTTFNGTGERAADMPVFSPGNTITFNVSSLTQDKELTLVSYKYNKTLSDTTVMYINQYTVTSGEASSGKPISYTVRANTEPGVYVLTINDSTHEVANFYYKVGSYTAELIDGSGESVALNTLGTPYRKEQDSHGNWSIGFLAKVTVNSGAVKLSDFGFHPGFTVTDNVKTKTYAFGMGESNTSKTVEALEEFEEFFTDSLGYDIEGPWSCVYGLTIFNVPNSVTNESEDGIQAKVVLTPELAH